MRRAQLDDLAAFAVLAEVRSFTRAAGRLGLSPSALSHLIRALEQRLGLQLLVRTTRSVAPTDAGERLLAVLRPALDEIGAGLAMLSASSDTPSGSLRITTFRHAAATVLSPVLPGFLERYPQIRVEVRVEDGLTDIVAEGFDAGIRWDDKVGSDMEAIRVGPDLRFAVVGSPGYLAAQPAPLAPRELNLHRCVGYRLKDSEAVYAWEFRKGRRAQQIRPAGPLVVNDEAMMLEASLSGLGLSFLYQDQVADHLASGRLVRVLADWCPANPGYCLYYPKRRLLPPALALFREALLTHYRVRAAPLGFSTVMADGKQANTSR